MNSNDTQTTSSDTSSLRDLFQVSDLRQRTKGQIIIFQGDQINHFYYIKQGFVRVYVITDEGDERTLLILTGNDIFPLLKDPGSSSNKSIYFYEAVVDTEIYSIDQQDMIKNIQNSHEASWAMFSYVSKFSSILTARIAQLESKSAEDKVEQLLEYLVGVCGRMIKPNVYKIQLKLTQQDIANLIGHTRETASLTIKKLRRQGVISYKDGYVVYYRASDSKTKFLEN